MASWDPDADLDILSSQTFNTPKYLFVFVINETDSYRMKKTFNINIEYLMNETYQLIDRLPLNGLTKKLINSSNLKCFLDELNGSETSDGSYDLATTSIEDYSSDLIRDKTIRKIFVLGSFDSDCFDILSKDNQLIISPLAIQYWIQMCSNNDIEFDIDEHLKYLQRPIFSECMKDTNVYFSKAISYTESIELYKRICLMNGTVTNKLDLNVTHAIIEPLLIENENGSQPGPQFKSSDTGINAASCLNVPVVNVDWINVAWRQLQLQYRFSSCKDYIASKLCHQLQKDCKPLLQQFTICIINSVYSEDDIQKINFSSILPRINNFIIRYGGTFFASPEYFHRVNLILHLTRNDKRTLSVTMNDNSFINELNRINGELIKRYEKDPIYRILKERCKKLPIVTVDWLLDSIIHDKVQPFDQYQIQVQTFNDSCRYNSLSKKTSQDEASKTWLDKLS